MIIKSLFSIVLFGVVLIAASSDTRAQCDCIGYTPDVRGSKYRSAVEDLNHSEVVFVGEVLEIRNVPKAKGASGEKNYELEVRFKIQRAWKRPVEEYVWVRNDVDSCIIGFKVGELYLVYADADGDLLRTWYCSRTRLVVQAKKDLDEFELKGIRPTEIKHAPKP